MAASPPPPATAARGWGRWRRGCGRHAEAGSLLGRAGSTCRAEMKMLDSLRHGRPGLRHAHRLRGALRVCRDGPRWTPRSAMSGTPTAPRRSRWTRVAQCSRVSVQVTDGGEFTRDLNIGSDAKPLLFAAEKNVGAHRRAVRHPPPAAGAKPSVSRAAGGFTALSSRTAMKIADDARRTCPFTRKRNIFAPAGRT